MARRSLSGSNIGGIAETQEMLDFCAEHGVTPEIEVIDPDYVNEAYERVLASDVRYRFVIDISSYDDAQPAASSSAASPSSSPGKWLTSIPASGQPAAASVAATRRCSPARRRGGSLGDELGDFVAVLAVGSRVWSVRDEFANFFDLILGQRCAAQQGEQRDLVGPGDALGVADLQPTDHRPRKPGCLEKSVRHPTSLTVEASQR